MKTTLIVVQRERFTSIIESLVSLFSTIALDVPVIVVEGGSPQSILMNLKKLQVTRPFEIISLPYMVLPQEARNLGFERVATEYVVFADNDISYEPGWLGALERNATENSSDLVAPLICIGPPNATTIHHAGGHLLMRVEENKPPHISEQHQLNDQSITALPSAQLPVGNEIVEFHCFLARTDYIRKIGPLDERLITREQIDFGLRSKYHKGRVTFEQSAVVTYMASNIFLEIDLPYLSFRWSDRLSLESLDHLKTTWGIEINRDGLMNSWIRPHRLGAYKSCYTRQFDELGQDRFIKELMTPLEQAAVAQAYATRPSRQPRLPSEPTPDQAQQFFAQIQNDPLENKAFQPAFLKRSKPMVCAGMSTTPRSGATFWQALKSLLPQVDRLYLFLDRFEHSPRLDHEKIVILTSEYFGDLRSNGKLLGLSMTSPGTYYFTVNDDIHYPADYCQRMIDHLQSRGHSVAVGVDGARLPTDGFNSYRADRTDIHLSSSLPLPVAIDVLGSGTTAFNTSALNFDVRAWRTRGMVDLSFACLAERMGVPRELIAREENWLEYLDVKPESSMERRMIQDDAVLTSLARELIKARQGH